jgi:ABC-type lipoprotein release transport system permease subunit
MEDNYSVIMIVLFVFGVIIGIIGNTVAVCIGVFMVVTSVLMALFSTTDIFDTAFLNRKVNWNWHDFYANVKKFPQAWWHSILPLPSGYALRMAMWLRQKYS